MASVSLICGRSITGIGSAGIQVGAFLIISHSVSIEKRPLYTGLIGAMYGIASVTEPYSGGAITDKITWRWCFYINLPLGAVTIAFIIFYFREPRRDSIVSLVCKQRVKELDLEGTALSLPGLVCLLLTLKWGSLAYSWSNWRIILPLVLFGVLLVVWVGVQIFKGDSATVPSNIMKKRSITATSWYNLAVGAWLLVLIYFLPLCFQAVKDTSVRDES